MFLPDAEAIHAKAQSMGLVPDGEPLTEPARRAALQELLDEQSRPKLDEREKPVVLSQTRVALDGDSYLLITVTRHH